MPDCGDVAAAGAGELSKVTPSVTTCRTTTSTVSAGHVEGSILHNLRSQGQVSSVRWLLNRFLAQASPCFNHPVGHPAEYQSSEPEQWLATIGDIRISQHWVSTPSGTFPIRGSVWTVADMSHYQERICPVGIVLAILFIWLCFLSLLFLLMKERSLVGYTQVTVQGNGFSHSALLPPGTLPIVTQQVNYARAVAAAA